ncbi:putative transporter [Colletotrichum trifolii]|uniref:Putative transporter n=1 Tax=Colletotrichum trifolii TaxID=5466 RepID=A0A4R8RD34_COLTR|nr:putative transporter [Colletotrichum trifolii]
MSTRNPAELAANQPGIMSGDVNSIRHVGTANDDADFEKIPKMEDVDAFGAHSKTDPKEIALVKKLDIYIIPILWLMYLFNFLDRNAIINARLNGLEADLGLEGTQYNTCVSILFVGYICGQIPFNMILNRVRPSWYMAGFCLAWSVVSLLTFKVQSYEGMIACRFFLGITEAPFYPGALYIISMFYTRKEVATRMSLFYTGNMLASSFSGLIAAGIFAGLDGSMGLAGWQWLFVIQGALSITVAIAALFLLPDHPLTTRWLSAEQRHLAHNRIYIDTTDRREATSVWVGLREACLDWRTWAFCLMYHLHLAANGFQNFLPTVMQTLGYSTTVTLALTCPPYILAALVGILVSWTSGRYNERTLHISVMKAIVLGGFVVAVATLNIAARLVGIVFFVGATFGINNLILGWASSTLGQTDEKKAVAIAMCNTLGSVASIYTPYLWPSTDSPRYLTAWMASIAFSVGVIIIAWWLRISLQRKNRKTKEQNPGETNFYVY